METLISILVIIAVIAFVITIAPFVITVIAIFILAAVIYGLYIHHKIKKQRKNMEDADQNQTEYFESYHTGFSSRDDDVIDVEFTESDDND